MKFDMSLYYYNNISYYENSSLYYEKKSQARRVYV